MAAIEGAEGIERRGLVLKLLTGLKQICNHPAQFLHQTTPIERPVRASSPPSTSCWT